MADMRDRLAELIADSFGVDPAYFDVDQFALADHLLANGVILPPCKVGDTVWFISHKYNILTHDWTGYVNEGYVKAIKLSSRPTKITVEYPDPESRQNAFKGADYNAHNVGKTLFLTREEAEKALREKDNG